MKLALVVDDSKYFRQTIKKILEQYNFVVMEAENGLEAYEKYVKYSPTLVTMDINMPVLDGFGSIKKILSYDKKAKILICSSMMFLDIYVAEGLSKGAKACLYKPFTENEFIDAVNQVLIEDE